MPDLTALADVSHYWGQDVATGSTGDFARAQRALLSKQRVFRRLLTNPGDYLFEPTYGAGLPAMVGTLVTPAAVKAVVAKQMRLEPSVSQTPAPTIDVASALGAISVKIGYTVLPDRQPVALAFDVTA